MATLDPRQQAALRDVRLSFPGFQDSDVTDILGVLAKHDYDVEAEGVLAEMHDLFINKEHRAFSQNLATLCSQFPELAEGIVAAELRGSIDNDLQAVARRLTDKRERLLHAQADDPQAQAPGGAAIARTQSAIVPQVNIKVEVYTKHNTKTMDIPDIAVVKTQPLEGFVPNSYDHICVFRPETSDHAVGDYLTYVWCSKPSAQHGGCIFPASLALYGDVEFRYIHYNGQAYVCVGKSDLFHIGPQCRLLPEVTADKQVNVRWYQTSGESLAPDAWIGLFAQGAYDTAPLAKASLDRSPEQAQFEGLKIPSGKHGVCKPFAAPEEAGTYELRLFSGGSRPVASSRPWDVDGPGSLTLAVSGTTLTATWAVPSFNPSGSDWVGIYRVDETPAMMYIYRRSPLRRFWYVAENEAQKEATLVHNGQYEARLVRADGITTKRSKVVTITEGQEG